jgi:hypothetical protein
MQKGIKILIKPVAVLGLILSGLCTAQTVTEPSVPIHIYNRNESIISAYKDSLSAQRTALEKAGSRIDSLQSRLQNIPPAETKDNSVFYLIIIILSLLVLILISVLARKRK